MVTRVIDDKDQLVSTISETAFWENFSLSYQGDPWNEYLYCPNCKKEEDFGPGNVYGYNRAFRLGISYCQFCHTTLQQFWSKKRVIKYFQETFEKHDDPVAITLWSPTCHLVGLIFGYRLLPKDITTSNLSRYLNEYGLENIFYLDLILVKKSQRRSKMYSVFRDLLILLKVRFFLREEGTPIDRLFDIIGTPRIVILYRSFINYLITGGYCNIITRTHKRANYVHKLLSLTRYKRLKIIDDQDNTREYFLSKIN